MKQRIGKGKNSKRSERMEKKHGGKVIKEGVREDIKQGIKNEGRDKNDDKEEE